MTFEQEIADRLGNTEKVVADPLRFKARLQIGEDAYTSLSLKKRAFELWDVAGAAMTGAQIAKSATVASTIFSTTSGGFFGLFAASTAVTPIGWVIAASVATGGAYYGVIHLMKGLEDGRVDVVPKFINTPIDVLAVGLADLITPLALKIASADGAITQEEREVLTSYYVDQWGFDQGYAEAVILLFEHSLNDYTLQQLTEGLRTFTKENRDCNEKKVRTGFVHMLREIAEADGTVHEMEELAIDHVASAIHRDPWVKIPALKLPSLPLPWRKSSSVDE